ncbi:phage tail protein, partial [Enterobacter hormaechei]
MLYNTGTIAINGNTATGTGTNWTAPASQIRVGQTLFVLSNPVQMFQITAINSATSLTITPAASPALSGQKFGILVTDSLSVDGLAQSMSQLINEYDENIGAWETFATTPANQNITVTINGARVTIPAIGKLVQKGSNGAAGVSDGGTGATNAADARTNLGLGSAATYNANSPTTAASNLLMVEGTGGLWGYVSPQGANDGRYNERTGFYAAPGGTGVNYFDAKECQRTDIDEQGFAWCGCGTANAEAEGITLSRLDIGVYMLTGSAGLASEGWQLLPPMDPGGMGEMGVVEAEQTESGGLTIRLFKRKYMLSDEGEIVKTKGEPMDVPVSSWIDVRLDMPTDSVFKRSQQRLQSDEES